jgi:hypothetical protein
VVGKKKKKKKKKKKRGGISYGNIEGERNRMGKEGILGVVKKIKNKNKKKYIKKWNSKIRIGSLM